MHAIAAASDTGSSNRVSSFVGLTLVCAFERARQGRFASVSDFACDHLQRAAFA
jgi:hypothetical protein